MEYMLAVLATVLLAFEFSFSKKYQTTEGTSLVAGLRFHMLAGLLSAVIMFAISGFSLEFSFYSLILAFSMAFCSSLYGILSFRVLKLGGMALYSTFLMSGGMLLPYLFGVLFLDEALTFLRILGVLVVLAGVILSGAGPSRFDRKLVLLCFAVFFLNGFVSILSKCHQITLTRPTVSSPVFAMYSGIGKFLFSAGALILCKPKGRPMKNKHSFTFVAGAALIGGISYLLQLVSARALPSTVLYPTITGGSIVFSALAGKVFFKETFKPRRILSILLCLIGTLLIL